MFWCFFYGKFLHFTNGSEQFLNLYFFPPILILIIFFLVIFFFDGWCLILLWMFTNSIFFFNVDDFNTICHLILISPYSHLFSSADWWIWIYIWIQYLPLLFWSLITNECFHFRWFQCSGCVGMGVRNVRNCRHRKGTATDHEDSMMKQGKHISTIIDDNERFNH